ncbi:hypothetical protein UlMin_012886 [Ulmus minor]
MALLAQNHVGSMIPLGRSESFAGSSHFNYNSEQNMMIEKRQLFLRSYQFCRKKSLTERIKRSLVRVKRIIWLRLKSGIRFRKLACFRIRCGFSYRRRRFVRLLNNYHHNHNCNNSNCFW